jgi:hypothetical protein
MGQSLFCEKDREVRSSRAIVLPWPLGGGTRLSLSLTSPKKNTKKAQEAPNPNIGANLSRT